MNNLLILGAGQYGIVVKEAAQSMMDFDRIDFLDDNNPESIGRLFQYEEFFNDYKFGIVALGAPNMRMILTGKIEKCGYVVPQIIHSSAAVSPSSSLGKGCIIEAGAVINANCRLGDGVIMSVNSAVNHNTVIGDYCHIGTGAVVPSNSSMKSNTILQPGTVYRPEWEDLF